MYTVSNITAAAKQTQTLVLEDGSALNLTVAFLPMQYGWFIVNLTYGSFTARGIRICNSPNLLHQYCNQLPFGLGCFSTGNREPTLQQDFSSGASKLYILTAAEVAQYAVYLQNG